MAIYRYLRTGFWQDDFIAELTPEEKYFYIYLMTNFKTTQCGIFKLVKRFVEAETGYNRETIDKLIKRFIDYGKILYCEETNEIIILNWIKYNFVNSKNTILCINKELKEVKNKEFVNIMYKLCLELNYNVESIFKDIEIDMDSEKDEENEGLADSYKRDLEQLEGTYKPLGEKEKYKYKEKEKSSSNKEKVINKNKDNSKNISRILLEFNKNICKPTKGDIEKIQLWIRDFEEEVIIAAIGEAVKYKVKHIGYIETVINNWRELGITTIEKFRQHKKKPDDKDSKMCNAAAYQYVD